MNTTLVALVGQAAVLYELSNSNSTLTVIKNIVIGYLFLRSLTDIVRHVRARGLVQSIQEVIQYVMRVRCALSLPLALLTVIHRSRFCWHYAFPQHASKSTRSWARLG